MLCVSGETMKEAKKLHRVLDRTTGKLVLIQEDMKQVATCVQQNMTTHYKPVLNKGYLWQITGHTPIIYQSGLQYKQIAQEL